jgi:hypothetical protein
MHIILNERKIIREVSKLPVEALCHKPVLYSSLDSPEQYASFHQLYTQL